MYSTHTLRFLATGEPSSPISGSAFLRPRLAGVLGADPSAAFLPRPRLGVGFCPCRPMSAQLHDEGWWVCGACAPRVRSLRLRRRHSSPSWRARAWAWWRAWAWALAPSRRPSSLLSVQRLPQGRRRAGGERDGHRPSSIFPLRFHDWRGAPAPVSRIPAGGGGGGAKLQRGGGGKQKKTHQKVQREGGGKQHQPPSTANTAVRPRRRRHRHPTSRCSRKRSFPATWRRRLPLRLL